MDRQIVLSESLGITTSLGALLRVVGFLIAATLGYATLRGDLNSAVEQGKRNAVELSVAQEQLNNARMDLRGLGSKFDEFMRSYDRDMNKYVRNDNDRR